MKEKQLERKKTCQDKEKLPMDAERQTATPKGHKKTIRLPFLMMAAFATVLLVAGCGNDDEDIPPVEDPAPPQTAPAPVQEEVAPPQEDDMISPQEEAESSQEPMNDEMNNPEDDEQM
ncbi:hypothetical protein VRRI112168_06575 [Vreelandella rituensis]|uniref:Uncharacterized protein n=1 Tax=Vreelandella rituensis TaxID=2282306 RepID=A0A368UAK0_9GAMM|nr:hypothetical protein [Halomonas rituensis]RCV93232.1 hypothetical protein DU506_03765 [Halomonas rituensis]